MTIKFNDLDFYEHSHHHAQSYKDMAALSCHQCPDFPDHFNLYHKYRQLKEFISSLKFAVSDQNLALLPEYGHRIKVLERLNFITKESHTIELKGRVACDINTSDELIVTEWIFDNSLSKLLPEEIVAIMSIFVFQDKVDEEEIFYPQDSNIPEVLFDFDFFSREC